MKSIYIAGPYTAETPELEAENVKIAARVAYQYIKGGWHIFCPHTMTTYIDIEINKDKSLKWEDWLILDIYWLTKCDAIHMLPGWKNSKGARFEYIVAKALGLEIRGDV
jgi:hypothetical protein